MLEELLSQPMLVALLTFIGIFFTTIIGMAVRDNIKGKK